jgi:hypothetical protein
VKQRIGGRLSRSELRCWVADDPDFYSWKNALGILTVFPEVLGEVRRLHEDVSLRLVDWSLSNVHELEGVGANMRKMERKEGWTNLKSLPVQPVSYFDNLST